MVVWRWARTPRSPSSTGTLRRTLRLREVVDQNCGWVLLCVARREEIRFPSVLLQPLGRPSALESTAYDVASFAKSPMVISALMVGDHLPAFQYRRSAAG